MSGRYELQLELDHGVKSTQQTRQSLHPHPLTSTRRGNQLRRCSQPAVIYHLPDPKSKHRLTFTALCSTPLLLFPEFQCSYIRRARVKPLLNCFIAVPGVRVHEQKYPQRLTAVSATTLRFGIRGKSYYKPAFSKVYGSTSTTSSTG